MTKIKDEHDVSDELTKILKDLLKDITDAFAEAFKDLKALRQHDPDPNNNQENPMADLSQLKSEIQGLGSVTQAVTRLIDFLVERLQQASQAGGNSQAEIDSLVSEVQASKQELVDTIANLPHPDNTLPS